MMRPPRVSSYVLLMWSTGSACVGEALFGPLRIVERVADGAAELVAARLRDRGDHAAGEAAELGRDAAGEDGRLLDGVLDVEGVRLAAEVLVHDGAVDEIEVVVRHGAGDACCR